MQNRYVGDVGDFAKYGLLRQLTAQSALRLGVVWCLFDNEVHNADGRHIGYLKSPVFHSLDPELHRILDKLLQAGRRSVKAIANSKVLAPGTVFYDTPIMKPDNDFVHRQLRLDRRTDWLKRAYTATTNCDFVFFDPDNGLETKSIPRYSAKGGKYVFWDELTPFWDRGQSLIVYHHLNRTASVEKQTGKLRENFESRFADAGLIRSFLFRRGSCRHFWLVAQDNHSSHCLSVIDRMSQSEWRKYFFVE